MNHIPTNDFCTRSCSEGKMISLLGPGVHVVRARTIRAQGGSAEDKFVPLRD